MPYFMLVEVKLFNLAVERSGVLEALTFDLNLELKSCNDKSVRNERLYKM